MRWMLYNELYKKFRYLKLYLFNFHCKNDLKIYSHGTPEDPKQR